ncbi:MAG: restriction endonuclease subunit M [Xanthomonadales bacterium]|nr:restriction endonuclease subunit M [Xanthomonadales bacterium]|tara:strand:+ start:804 stop:2018 length:1215 start_codon:yes stop_codon:yes gene_type:complete
MWRECRLGEVSDIRYGYTAKASADIAGPKFLRITDIQNDAVNWPTVPVCPITSQDLEKHRLQKGDIVFARTGATTGKSYRILDGPEAVAASYLIRVRITEKGLTSAFLELFFKSADYWTQVKTGTIGSAQGGFNASKLAELKILVPPPEEQKRIVAILDEAFAGIETAIANTEKNLANARELFLAFLKLVFVQGRSGWKEVAVSDFADACLGKMLDKRKNKGTPRPYLRNINVRWFGVDTSDLLEMKIEEKELERYMVRKGDLLICEGGYPGRAAVWEKDEPVFFQKAVHRVRCHDPAHTRWLMYFLYLADATGYLRSSFTGAGIQHFTGQSLKRFKVPIAPPDQASELTFRIDDLRGDLERLEATHKRKLCALQELKQSLLQKAFSGELTADRVEEELESATV